MEVEGYLQQSGEKDIENYFKGYIQGHWDVYFLRLQYSFSLKDVLFKLLCSLP